MKEALLSFIPHPKFSPLSLTERGLFFLHLNGS
jgi:hypothetical protein